MEWEDFIRKGFEDAAIKYSLNWNRKEDRKLFLEWLNTCDARGGYPLLRTSYGGKKFKRNRVFGVCYGGERLDKYTHPILGLGECVWIENVPQHVIKRIEEETDSYEWLKKLLDNPGNPGGGREMRKTTEVLRKIAERIRPDVVQLTSSLKNVIEAHEEALMTLGEDIDSLRDDVAELKKDVHDLKEELKKETDYEKLKRKIEAIKEDHKNIDELSKIMADLAKGRYDVTESEKRVLMDLIRETMMKI